MSYGAEWIADHSFERDYPFGLPGDVWSTRDGRKIKLADMSDSHIRNCMRIVGEDDGWYSRFQQELQSRRGYNV